MSAVSDRINQMVVSTHLSVRELARRIGVSHVSLHQWVSGKNEPSKDGLEALCTYFEVTPAYVLYGDGNAPTGQAICNDDTVSIPLIDVEASCGHGALNDQMVTLIRFIKVSYELIRRYCPAARVGSLQIVTAVGDSMEPTLHDGDSIIVDRSETRVRRDGMYALRFGDGIFIKRVQVTPGGARLISDNGLYPPIDAGLDELSIIGRCYVGVCLKRL